MNNRCATILIIILFSACFFFIDRGIYYLCLSGYQKIPRAESGGMVPDALRHKADVVILGSSLARHHYVPAILEEKLGVSVYNLGADGQGLAFVRCAVDILLAYYQPETIILDISPGMLSVQTQELTVPRVKSLAAYLDESEVVREVIYEKGPFEKLKFVSKAFRFNDLPIRYLYNGLFPRKDLAELNGFSPIQRVYDPKGETRKADEWTLDYAAKEGLRAVLCQAQERGVRVIIVQSPHWFWNDAPASPLHVLYTAVKEVAEDEQVPFIEITPQKYKQFKNHRLYANASHLNYEGAKIFSFILAERVLTAQPIRARSGCAERNLRTYGVPDVCFFEGKKFLPVMLLHKGQKHQYCPQSRLEIPLS